MIRQWTAELDRTVNHIRRQSAQDFLSMLSPERQQAVRDSQESYNQRAVSVPSVPALEPLVEGWDEDEEWDGIDSEAGDQ